jgi:hypothetical protein
MFRRPSIRATGTTLAAAAVLVGGANLASYAANGHPLLLGHKNSAVGTTSLKNAGRGPALSLNSAKSAPPLVVNSKKMVKHLNADSVDGLGAKDLNGYLQYHVGQDGQILSNDQHLVTAKIPTGTYAWSMAGLWTSATTADNMQCLIVDQRLLADISNVNYIYASFSKSGGDPDAPFINQSGFSHFSKSQTLILGCITTGDTGPVTTVRAVRFSFHPVITEPKTGHPITVTKNRLGRLSGIAGQ